MLDKMKQLYDMQKKAKEMQKTMRAVKVDKTSPGGKLRLVMNGNFEVETLTIDPALLAPEHKAILEKGLSELINDVSDDVRQESAKHAMDMMKGLNLPGL